MSQPHKSDKMEYEEFIRHYVPELALLDAIDYLKTYPALGSETLDQMVSHTKDDKSDELHAQKDPTL